MKRLTLAVVAALLVLAPLHETVRATPPLYTVEDLGMFGGAVPHVTGVNASGQVVGWAELPSGVTQAVRYTDGAWQAIPGVDGAGFSVGTGINASGDVVGYYFTASFELHPFRYSDTGGLETIAFLEGGTFGAGFAINNAGTVVGYGNSSTAMSQAFRAEPGLPPVALPSLNDGSPAAASLACGINAAGQVVGYSTTPDGPQHGMRIDAGASSAVDIAPPDGALGNVFQACAIDTDGVVGGSGDVSTVLRGFRSNGVAVNLDVFPASVTSSVEAIASGLSVGWYQTDSVDTTNEATMRAFAHRDADGSFDLNTRIDDANWVLNTARGVNANGVIVGNGLLKGVRAAYRLTPVAPDTTPPVIDSVLANPSSIAPADNRVVPVAVTVSASDNSGVAPVCSVTGVTGGAAGDASVTGALSVQVKAKSAVVYTVSVRCVDAKNNFSDGAASVTVVTAPKPTDTKAPVIRFLRAQRTETKLGGVKWELVRLFVWATDNTDHSPFCSITSITGGPAGSYAITGRLTARLRELKSAGDLDRVYHLNVSCVDNDGNAAKATVNIDPNGRTTYSGDVRRWHW